MRLRPGLDHNLTVMRHAHLCQRLFQLDVNRDGEVERTGKAARAAANAGKVAKGALFKLPAGVVPLSNNSRRTDIIAMMRDFNAHGLDPNWVEPEDIQVQEFFDTLHEGYVTAEPWLVQGTSQVELDYIAARAAEAKLAEESGSTGGVVDKAAAEAEEKELAQWAEAAGEASSAGTGAPLIEDVVGESLEEEAEEEEAVAVDPPATGRGRVLRRATSSEPVRPAGPRSCGRLRRCPHARRGPRRRRKW